MKKQNIISSIVIIISFLLCIYIKRILDIKIIQKINSYILWIFITFFTTGILYKFKNILSKLGLNSNVLSGLLFSFICVFPMLAGSIFLNINNFKIDIKLVDILKISLLAGFMEELLFRGFLTGLLFKYNQWGFIPATIIGALIFGLGHLYQGSGFASSLTIFVITFIGAIWFSWLYVEWNFNLWVPAFIHIFMNFSWIFYSSSTTVIGNNISNFFRIITIFLTIFLTIKYKKYKNLPFIVNRNTLMYKK